VRGVLLHAMSGTELSRVRTEFRLRLLEPINKSTPESRGADIVMQSSEVLVRQMSGNATNQDLVCNCLSRLLVGGGFLDDDPKCVGFIPVSSRRNGRQAPRRQSRP